MSTLSDPTVQAFEFDPSEQLRRRAAARLTGPAGSKCSTARAADALGVLHALASSPATAPDALALLHELQVHQIEIELQAQELRESQADVEAALRRRTELYDGLPVGCFVLDAHRRVRELNLGGAEMLGLDRDEAFGFPLETCLDAESARRLHVALAAVEAGQRRVACPLTLLRKGAAAQAVIASLCRDTVPQQVLVSLTPAGDGTAS